MRLSQISEFSFSSLLRVHQKSELRLFYGSPTTEAVGSNFETSIEPTALVVGARTNIRSQFDRTDF
jgi:hypothetical protein